MDVFQDKIAIVTGGASGIGRELCRQMAGRGAVVIVADINAPGAEAVAAEIAAQGRRARAVPTDVTDAQAVDALVRGAVAEHGRLDYMFNNAGIAFTADARDLRPEHWRRVLDLNLWGVIHGTSAAYAVMAAQGHGHIVNVASLAGLVPLPTNTPYSASKHAVVGLSLSLRVEAMDLGVKVSVVCPGFVQTAIYQTSPVLNAPLEPVMAGIPFKLVDTDRAVRAILRGVARNQAVIAVPGAMRLLWWVHRLNAELLTPIGLRMIRNFRRVRTVPSAEPVAAVGAPTASGSSRPTA